MTEQQMRNTLQNMVNQYEPNPEFLLSKESMNITDDFCKLYHWYLRDRPLTGLLLRMEIAPAREEAEELSAREIANNNNPAQSAHNHGKERIR